MTSSSPAAAQTEEDLGGSSSSDDAAPNPSAAAKPDTAAAAAAANSTNSTTIIAKEDLIELIRAVKFKNSDFSQRQVYEEIVTEIPKKFPQYEESLNPNTLSLNDVKKAWKKAILQQQQPRQGQGSNSSSNNNNDLADKLRKMTTTPEVYTIGLGNNNPTEGSSSSSPSLSSSLPGSSMARDYVARFLEEQQVETDAQQRQLLEDYVHVFLDVPMDSSVTKMPHQALINFQSRTPKIKGSNNNNNNKKNKKGNAKHNKKKSGKASSSVASAEGAFLLPPPPFQDAIVVKIQMAAPIDANDTAKHAMLLYDQTKTYKTFVHPDGALMGGGASLSATPVAAAAVASTNTTNTDNGGVLEDDSDGYSRLAHWIRTKGVDGALGATGGTKAYFYGRLTNAGASTKPILSLYVKSLAPSQDW